MALYLTSREGYGNPVGWRLLMKKGASHPSLHIDIQLGVGPRSGIHPVTDEPDIHYAACQVHGKDMVVPVLARLLALGVPGEVEKEPW